VIKNIKEKITKHLKIAVSAAIVIVTGVGLLKICVKASEMPGKIANADLLNMTAGQKFKFFISLL
jgi:hypothetical protein